MMIGQGNSCCGCQRNPFVRRAKNNIKIYVGVFDGSRIITAKLCEGATSLKAASIKKVGTGAARLEGELTKAKGLVFNRQLDKVVLVFLHANFLFMN